MWYYGKLQAPPGESDLEVIMLYSQSDATARWYLPYVLRTLIPFRRTEQFLNEDVEHSVENLIGQGGPIVVQIGSKILIHSAYNYHPYSGR